MADVRVAFDDQIFEAQARGGFSKYFVELIKRLPAHGVEPVLLSRETRNLHLAESGLVPRAAERGRLATRVTWASWRAVGIPRAQSRRLPDFDVLHHTYTHASYLHVTQAPRVVTIVDMTPEIFPSLFPWGNPHFAKRRFAESCDAIVSISDSTTRDMGRIYGEHLINKTRTIHFGIGEEFLATTASDHLQLPARFALFVGMRGGYKDFPVAVKALEILRSEPEHADLQLVIAGGGPLSSADRALLERHGLAADSTYVRPVDADMPELYRKASVFIFPSRYEGFGMPTLEALAAGTPTVLADASCSREIGGTLARYFAPGDAAELASAARAALADNGAEQARIRVAYAREFTWDQTAAAHAELYRALAASRRA